MQATAQDWLPSGKSRPCPICGRTKDGDCRISGDGLEVICHHPKDLKPGEVVDGWAFTGNTSDDRAGHFTIDKPRTGAPSRPGKVVPIRPPAPAAAAAAPAPDPATVTLARLPEPGQEPPAHWPNGQKLAYGSDGRQWVKVVVKDGEKNHYANHLDASGKAIYKAGPDPWPLWGESTALEHGSGRWIVEAEGEKCAAWFHAAGLVAVSQPGHAHTLDAIQARYARLAAAGVAGVVYLADHDEKGAEKAQRCRFAAARARTGDQFEGLPFITVPAAEVWPGLPAGGSIDDAPGTAAERVATFVAHLQQRKQEQQAAPSAGNDAGAKTKPTPEAIEAYLRQEISEGISEAALATLITTLSLESDIHASTIQQVANRLKDEHRRKLEVQAEAQAIAAEADRQELGQALTPAYILPPAIAAAIQIRTRYLPCDGPSAVLPFLTAAAGLVKLGTQVQASAAAGYSVPINLNSCLVGKSGAMKSPVGRLTVDAPTQELQAELARANQLDHSQWEETCKELKKGEPRPAKPRPKRLKVSDFTGEALADQLQTQETHGLGLLIHRDELSGLFGSLNAYRGGKGGDEQQLLELFDGGGLNSLRVMGDRHYSRSQVSIYGSTQPDVLRQLVADGDASGLWARFLFVPLPERPVQLPIATSVAEVAEVDAAAETLAKVCRSIYTMPPQTYHLSPAAAEQFARYHYSRQQAALAAATGAESALYGKSAGKVLRVAGVLHLLQIATGQASNSDRIEPPTIDRATSLVDHLDAWALSFHAEVAAGGIGQLMRTVHTASEATAGPVRWTDLQRRLSRSQRKEIDSAAVADAMQALTAAGYGEVERLRNGGLSYRALRPLP